MADSIAFSVAPYHILSYGALLGTSLFHSFVNGPVLFKTVDRPSFSAAQSRLFPIYFGIQTAFSATLALTLPGNALTGAPSGISGLLDASRRWDSLAPIAVMFLSSLVNLSVLLPVITEVIKVRRGPGKRDGPHSDQEFGMLHRISSLLNLTTSISTIVYGFTLGSRVQSLR